MIALVARLRALTPSLGVMAEPVARLVREALAELVAVTGLDTMYLTRVDLDRDVQHVVLAHSAGEELVPEGLVVGCGDTLCKRACDDGPAYTTNVPGTFPDSRAARELGLMTYISVPIRKSGGELVGTLCGASAAPCELTADTRTLIETFAHVIGRQLVTAPRAEAAVGS